MPGPPGEQNILEQLTAFADGELDAAQNLGVLSYIASHPEALELMDQEQRLRLAARRVVRDRTPAATPALRARIEALAASASDPVTLEQKRNRDGRRWWIAMMACLLLLLGTIGGRFAWPRDEVAFAPMPAAARRVPVSLAQAVIRVHAECSGSAELHGSTYPIELDELASAVRADLNREVPYPDMSRAGYQLIGAGPCRRPLENTIHSLYRGTGENVSDVFSLFMQSYTGQVQLDAGKAYLLTAEDAPHPVFVWRSDRVAYFLVADEMHVIDHARAFIGVPRL